MEWSQLENFHAVAQLEHFTLAAKKLSLSQPALSRSIARLESELGVPLFDRVGRRVKLNSFGRMFHRRTVRILQEMKEASQEIDDWQSPERGTISLAFLKSLGTSFVPRLVRAFSNQYPQVNFQLFQNATNVMLDQLENGEIDYGLSYVTETRPGIECAQLWTEELFIFVPSSHPLAQNRSLALADIAHERFVVLKRGYGIRTVFDRLWAQRGVQPNIAFEGEDVASVMGFVAANLGITLLPHVARLDMTDISRLTVSDCRCERSIGLLWREDRYRTPAARSFQQFLVAFCSGEAADRQRGTDQ
jgi:DNA-binding transcriptional LysR family regulator